MTEPNHHAEASVAIVHDAHGISRGFVVAWVLLTGALVAAIVFGATAFYINYTENQRQAADAHRREMERTERSEELNQYLRLACRNDQRGRQVLIDILQDAAKTADSADTRAYWRAKSARLVTISEECFAQIPPPLPNPEGD